MGLRHAVAAAVLGAPLADILRMTALRAGSVSASVVISRIMSPPTFGPRTPVPRPPAMPTGTVTHTRPPTFSASSVVAAAVRDEGNPSIRTVKVTPSASLLTANVRFSALAASAYNLLSFDIVAPPWPAERIRRPVRFPCPKSAGTVPAAPGRESSSRARDRLPQPAERGTAHGQGRPLIATAPTHPKPEHGKNDRASVSRGGGVFRLERGHAAPVAAGVGGRD